MHTGNKVNIKLFLVLLAIMVVVLFPRFDRLDRFGIDNFTTKGKPAAVFLADAGKYVNYIRYFRGEVSSEVLQPPWAYRPLPTYLASLLPLKPITAINVINFIFLSLGLFFLLKTLAFIGISSNTIRLGGLGYVFSFPVFFYGGIGYIDPVLIGMLSIGVFLILTHQNLLFFCLLILGAFVKEVFIIILPAWAVYQYSLSNFKWVRTALISVFSFIAFMALLYVIRDITPVRSDYYWAPKKEFLDFNLYRMNAWVTWLITFGPIGFFATWYCLKKNFALLKEPVTICFAAGLAGAIAVIIYSFFTVFVDGRYIWIAYPFMIPLASQYWDEKRMFKSTRE